MSKRTSSSTTEPSPASSFGAAVKIVCETCGTVDLTAREAETVEERVGWHRRLDHGEVRVEEVPI